MVPFQLEFWLVYEQCEAAGAARKNTQVGQNTLLPPECVICEIVVVAFTSYCSITEEKLQGIMNILSADERSPFKRCRE
jgi:hypothetical protein